MKEWIKAVVILPFNVTVVIPFLILYFSRYSFSLANKLQLVLGIILLFIGLFIAIWTMILFHKVGKGTLAPWAATKHLVVEGPYKIVRNPMILGILAILTSESLILNTLYIFYWAVLFFLVNCLYFKVFEEKQLERNFGEEYIEYRKKVPMWFPKIKFW